MGIFRGATFNLAHNLGQMLHLRPRNRFEDCGRRLSDRRRAPIRAAACPTIFESARIAAKLAADDMGLVAPAMKAAAE